MPARAFRAPIPVEEHTSTLRGLFLFAFGAFLGAWSRYIPDRHRARHLMAATPLIAIAPVGGLPTGTTALYGTGLGFSSIFNRLSRVPSTALIGTLSVAFVFVGDLVLDIVSGINAFATLIALCTLALGGDHDDRLLRTPRPLPPGRHPGLQQGPAGRRPRLHERCRPAGTGDWPTATMAGPVFANTPLIAGPWRNTAGAWPQVSRRRSSLPR